MKKILVFVTLSFILVSCGDPSLKQTTKLVKSGQSYHWAQVIAAKSQNKASMGFTCIKCFFTSTGNSYDEAVNRAMELCNNSKAVKKNPKRSCYLDKHIGSKPEAIRAAKIAKVRSTNIENQTTSNSGSSIDPSVWDDIFNASQGILGGKSLSESLSGTSSNSASTSISCFKKSESVSGTNKICIYNCMGSDTAINVKSTQLCPMSIKN